MLRYLVSALFFFVTPIFADWDDDEDDYIEEDRLKPNPITYGSLTIECYSGCGEFIGYAVNKDTGEKIATTMGKIHYAQDGVHIVPYVSK